MAIHRLDPPMPLSTPKGTGLAHLVIDYGLEFNLTWVVFLDDSGECWSFDNPDVRAMPNLTYRAERKNGFQERHVSTS